MSLNPGSGLVMKILKYLSRGVVPENLRRGPYAVVDERCEKTALFNIFIFTTARFLATFLDPSTEDLLLRGFWLLFWTQV